MTLYDRIYAKIDLDAIRHNMEEMKKRIRPDTKIIAVIKADGYGHGAVPIAAEIQGLSYLQGFAVATVEEALILRRNGVKKPILILGYSFHNQDALVAEYDLCPTIFSIETAELLSDAARKLKKEVRIHIAIDTGMSRIGFQVTEECADEICKIGRLPGIFIEGIFTHFARADEREKEPTYRQIKLFEKMLSMLENRGLRIPLKHCSNSAGIVDLPRANMDAVRAGITLYGLWPSSEVNKEQMDLAPVMELKSRIVHIKELECGRSVSYGGTYTLSKEERIATIPVGYADGYPRSLSNCGYVLIHGKKAPIRGRICMDQFMVDVTGIKEARAGDRVTLIGSDEGAFLSMEEAGELSGRFHYEFACDITKRVPRVYYKNKKIVKMKDYFKE